MIFSCIFFSVDVYSQCIGGQVLISNSTDKASICLEDALSQGIEVYNTSYAPTNYAYAITDINNQILSITNSNQLGFDGLIDGSYYVYGFSYLGDIKAGLGDYVYTTRFSSSCWQISYNRVEILLATPLASEIRTGDYKTSKNLCLNQGAPDFVSFQNITGRNTPYVFLITDEDDRILEVNYNSFADFSNSPAGNCKVYGLAYTGQLLAQYGMQISEVLSTGCYELSDNTIEVNRALVDGGNVFTQDFKSFYSISTDDGLSDQLDFTNSGSIQADYTYILTDAFNNVIERLDEPTIDFEGFDPGTYRIWGFSYSGNILIGEGQSIFSGSFTDGCFSRSFNAITITAIHEGAGPSPCNLTGTEISALNETTVCQNGPIDQIVTDASMGQGFESALVLVDNTNTIIQIDQAAEVSLFSILPGEYSIYQIVYEQISGFHIGSDFNSLAGCFVESNSIQIQILSEDDENCISEEECLIKASTLTADKETICIEDLENNTVSFNVENEGEEQSGILITNANGIIIELSADRIFEIEDVGTQTYYHINYENTVEIFGGASIGDLEGCFELSNGISITGIDNCFVEPCDLLPSTISTLDATNLCTLIEDDDMISINSNGMSGETQVYLLTTAGSDQIISTSATGEFTFTEEQVGEFEIYLLNYNQPFILGTTIGEFEGCFALSAPISVSNSDDNCIIEPIDCQNEGGQITYNGPTGICGSDGQNDIININVQVSGGNNRVFLLVNETGTIISVAPALLVLNNPFPSGNYEVFALSYEEFPTGLTTNENLGDFSDLCLSNSVQISVSDDFCKGSGVRGGEVADEFGEDRIKLCTDVAGEVFTINLNNTGSTAFDYTYIETDQNNIITSILNSSSIMYTADPTERMNKRIWGVSYTGSFAAFVGENITSVALSDDTFSVSDNFIEVEISVVIGESPEIIGEEAPFIELPADQENVINLSPNMSAFLDYETAYILFDLDGVTIIDILYPDENFQITLPELSATPLTGELLTLSAVAYTGNILLEPGGQANEPFLPNATDVTDGCFDVGDTNIAIRVFDTTGGDMPLNNSIIENINKEEISLRPNPVSEIMEVTFPKSFVDQKTTLNIYSISGELILNMNFEKAPTVELIDVSNFSVGTYTLQAYTNFSARTIQFLKI